VDHLLLHCEVVCAMWNVFFSQFGLSWVMPRRVVDLYACWWTIDNTWKMLCGRWYLREAEGKIRGTLMLLLWCLWRKMNDRSFEDHKRTLEEIKFLFFNTLYLWTVVLSCLPNSPNHVVNTLLIR
jgi:hypothetical protein